VLTHHRLTPRLTDHGRSTGSRLHVSRCSRYVALRCAVLDRAPKHRVYLPAFMHFASALCLPIDRHTEARDGKICRPNIKTAHDVKHSFLDTTRNALNERREVRNKRYRRRLRKRSLRKRQTSFIPTATLTESILKTEVRRQSITGNKTIGPLQAKTIKSLKLRWLVLQLHGKIQNFRLRKTGRSVAKAIAITTGKIGARSRQSDIFTGRSLS